VARRLADHLVVLVAGRVENEGPPEEILPHAASGSFHAEPLADAKPPLGKRTPEPENLHDVPLWIAGVVLLAAMTATVLALGGRGPVEAAIIIGVWLVAGSVFAARGRG
jgi:hypothetical protein